MGSAKAQVVARLVASELGGASRASRCGAAMPRCTWVQVEVRARQHAVRRFDITPYYAHCCVINRTAARGAVQHRHDWRAGGRDRGKGRGPLPAEVTGCRVGVGGGWPRQERPADVITLGVPVHGMENFVWVVGKFFICYMGAWQLT